MTSELSKEAAELVKHGRDALRPTVADKERVLSALRSQLAPGEPSGGSEVNAGASGVGTKALLLGSGATVAIAAVIGLTLRSQDVTHDARTETLDVATSTSPHVDTISSPDEAPVDVSQLEPVVPTDPAAEPVVSTPANVPAVTTRGNASDRLAEEVALLTRAQREFHAGNLNAALASVNEHQRKFARGTLG